MSYLTPAKMQALRSYWLATKRRLNKAGDARDGMKDIIPAYELGYVPRTDASAIEREAMFNLAIAISNTRNS